MGLTKGKLLKHDAFFFWQLLFPICDQAFSTIENDPRLPFYSKVEKWSQKYAATQGIGGSYGHECKPVLAADLLHFDMAVVRDGVLGGMDGAIYRSGQKANPTMILRQPPPSPTLDGCRSKGHTSYVTMI